MTNSEWLICSDATLSALSYCLIFISVCLSYRLPRLAAYWEHALKLSSGNKNSRPGQHYVRGKETHEWVSRSLPSLPWHSKTNSSLKLLNHHLSSSPFHFFLFLLLLLLLLLIYPLLLQCRWRRVYLFSCQPWYFPPIPCKHPAHSPPTSRPLPALTSHTFHPGKDTFKQRAR